MNLDKDRQLLEPIHFGNPHMLNKENVKEAAKITILNTDVSTLDRMKTENQLLIMLLIILMASVRMRDIPLSEKCLPTTKTMTYNRTLNKD